MAQIILQYCNNSLGAVVEVAYDDVTHQVAAFGAPSVSVCTDPQPDVIYEQIDGNTIYQVVPTNISPYARVNEVPLVTCTIAIDSIVTTKSTDDQTADGTATVNATGSGVKSYSLDNGATYQVSNIFTGLLPGTYSVTVRNQISGGTSCFATQQFKILPDQVACTLKLGQINVEGDSGATDGSIVVESLQNVLKPVEYRLDAGAWQLSPEFTGLAAGVYSVQVRYLDQTSCLDSKDITVGAITCDIRITQVIAIGESSLFANDGSIQVTATSSNGPITYSINGGQDYQASEIFASLTPGTYALQVKDAQDCIAFQQVLITKYRPASFEVPLAQTHRFVVANTDPPDFDNRLFAEYHHEGAAVCEYLTKVLTAEFTLVQFKSNYASNLLKIKAYADQSTVDTLSPLKKSNNLDYTEVLAGYAHVNSLTTYTEVYFLNGLPEWVKVGQVVTLSDFGQVALNGEHEIIEVRAGSQEAEGFEVMVLDIPAAIFEGQSLGDVTVVYDLEPAEVYEQTLDWSQYPAGEYYLSLEASDSRYTDISATSEPIKTAISFPGTKVIRFKNIEDAFGIQYSTGIEGMLRVTAEFEYPEMKGQRSMHQDSRNELIKLQEYVAKYVPIRIFQVPYYLMMQIALAFAHDVLTIEGVQYATEEDLEREVFDEDTLVDIIATLRQVKFIAENSDDGGDVDEPIYVLGLNNYLLEVNP